MSVSEDSAVTIHTTLDDMWCRGFATLNNVSEERRLIHDQMLMAIRLPSGFAVLMDGNWSLHSSPEDGDRALPRPISK